jgi:hypothetical protein
MALILQMFCGDRAPVWQIVSLAPERHLSNILQRGGKQALIGIGPGHGKENAPDALNYPGSDFEQLELEGVDRGSSQLSPGKATRRRQSGTKAKVCSSSRNRSASFFFTVRTSLRKKLFFLQGRRFLLLTTAF